MNEVIGRKTGWRERRRLHVIEAKTPLRDDRKEEPYYLDDIYYHHGYCCNEYRDQDDWFAPLMRAMVVVLDGLVHVTLPADSTTVCGLEHGRLLNVDIRSSDQAKAYSKKNAGDPREITCIQCIAEAHIWTVFWW